MMKGKDKMISFNRSEWRACYTVIRGCVAGALQSGNQAALARSKYPDVESSEFITTLADWIAYRAG